MAHFILHVGQSKTGTTAIQHFLAANRGALRRRGILYPDIRNRGRSLGAPDHNLVAWSLVGKNSPIGVPFEAFLQDVYADLRRDPALHTVILSAEAFLGEPHIWEFDSEDAWRHANQEKLHKLHHALRGHQVTILVYLRRQDYWVNSAFNHIIKVEGLVGRQLYSDIRQFIECMGPRLDYAQELASWGECFGHGEIIVRPYEKMQLQGGDAVTDFLAQLGLSDADSQFVRPSSRESRNLGLPRDVLEVKRVLNRVPRKKPEERVLIWALQKIGSEMPSEDVAWDFLLSVEERRALIARFAATNRAVAERYFASADGTLFRESPPENGGAEYPGLSSGRASEIVLRLQRVLKSFAGRRLYLRYVFGDLARRHFLRGYVLLRPLYRRWVH